MATKQRPGVFDSLSWHLLLLPFRWLLLLMLVISLLLGTALLAHLVLEQQSAAATLTHTLRQEYQWLIWLMQDDMPLKLASSLSHWLGWLLFDVTGIQQALLEQQVGTFGYNIKTRLLLPHYEVLQLIDQAKTLVGVRLSFLLMMLLLSVFLTLPAVVDGLVERAIRKASAGRESSGLYHRAKFWRHGLWALVILFYLSWPLPVHPTLLLVPVLISTLLTRLQFKYWKKYL